MSWPGARLGAPRSKYHATPCVAHGVRFDSKAEARRYQELLALEAAGAIQHIELQPSWELHALGGRKVATYRADFSYWSVADQARVVEDVKGVRTPMYRLKRKWMHAEYGIDVIEVVF